MSEKIKLIVDAMPFPAHMERSYKSQYNCHKQMPLSVTLRLALCIIKHVWLTINNYMPAQTNTLTAQFNLSIQGISYEYLPEEGINVFAYWHFLNVQRFFLIASCLHIRSRTLLFFSFYNVHHVQYKSENKAIQDRLAGTHHLHYSVLICMVSECSCEF